MTTFQKRTTLLATSLAFGLFAALQLPQAMAGNKGGEYQEKPRSSNAATPATPAQKSRPNAQGGMMDHGQMGTDRMSASGMDHNNMDHDRAMQQMHDKHMNQGQMDHGNMGQGQMNHGSMPPAKAAPNTKDRKNGR